MSCASTKNKSEKFSFYFTFYSMYMLYFITKYKCMDKNYSFHLIDNMIFYSSWFVSYEGKPYTTPGPVLSILKAVKCQSRQKSKSTKKKAKNATPKTRQQHKRGKVKNINFLSKQKQKKRPTLAKRKEEKTKK